MSVAQEVDSFAIAVQELPENMRMFSTCLKSLYVENAVGSSACNATGINRIRDQMRQDAIVYMKGVFPLSIQMLKYAQAFFEHYEMLELDKWKEYLPDILEEVTGYQQCCTEIVRMHEEMMVHLKRRENEAKLLISGIHDTNKELKKKRAQLEKEAANSKAWAYRLIFVPIVGLFASPRLYKSAKEDLAQAVAKGKQVGINEAAIVVVRDVLAQALSTFIVGLNTVAGFFRVMKQELTSLRSSTANQRAQLHYIMMKRIAVEVNDIIIEFHAMIPKVRDDLQCIPQKPVDLEYFDAWQIKQQDVIYMIYKHLLTAKSKALLRKCESIDAIQQLAITN